MSKSQTCSHSAKAKMYINVIERLLLALLALLQFLSQELLAAPQVRVCGVEVMAHALKVSKTT